MTQLLYKYAKCAECGHQDFQWGMIVDSSFICRDCVANILQKLDDLIDEAKHKTKIPIKLQIRRD